MNNPFYLHAIRKYNKFETSKKSNPIAKKQLITERAERAEVHTNSVFHQSNNEQSAGLIVDEFQEKKTVLFGNVPIFASGI